MPRNVENLGGAWGSDERNNRKSLGANLEVEKRHVIIASVFMGESENGIFIIAP